MPGRAKVIFEGDAAKAIKEVDKLTARVDRLTNQLRKTKEESRKGAKSQEKDSDATAQALGRVAMQYVGIQQAIGLVRRAHEAWRQDMQTNLELAKEMGEAFKDLAFLGENYKRSYQMAPHLFELARKYGVEGGAPEIAKGQYRFESFTGGLGARFKKGLFPEILQHRRISSLPVGQLTELYAKAAPYAEREKLTPNELQNIIVQFVERAAADPEALTGQYPRALTGGAGIGGMSLREATAMLSMLTRKTGTVRQATGPMIAMVRRLMLAGEAPEGGPMPPGRKRRISPMAQFLQQAGITKGMTATERLGKLAQMFQGGKLDLAQMEQLVGAEAIMALSPLMKGWGEYQAELGIFQKTTGPGVDLAQQKWATAMRDDPRFRAAFKVRQQAARVAGARWMKAPQALEHQASLDAMEAGMMEQGMSAFERSVRLRAYEWGIPPEVTNQAVKALSTLPSAMTQGFVPDVPAEGTGYRQRMDRDLAEAMGDKPIKVNIVSDERGKTAGGTQPPHGE